MADVVIQRLAKAFGGAPVLRGVDLVVPSGSNTAIVGASGSGKTTLLRLLSGFERSDAGVIEIGGRLMLGPGAHTPPERRQIAYVAQEGSLFPHLSVADNVVSRLPPAQRRDRARAEALLQGVGLPTHYTPRGRPTNSQAANNSAWRLRPRPGSCCSTSPSPLWTPPCGSKPGRPSRTHSRPPARPLC